MYFPYLGNTLCLDFKIVFHENRSRICFSSRCEYLQWLLTISITVFEQIRRCQRTPYKFKEDAFIQYYLANRIILKETDLFIGSKTAEPKLDPQVEMKKREQEKKQRKIEKQHERAAEKAKKIEAKEERKKKKEQEVSHVKYTE